MSTRAYGKRVIYILFGSTLIFFGAVGYASAASLFSVDVSLVHPSGSSQIYALVNKQKYLIRTPAILQSYAYRSVHIQTIDAEAVAATPNVTLIYSSLGPRHYVLERQEQKLWAPTDDSLTASGFDTTTLVQVSQFDARSYRNAVIVKSANDPKVYYLDYSTVTREPIANESDFLSSGFSWADVVTAPDAIINAYTLGSTFVPGSVPVPQPTPAPTTTPVPGSGPTVTVTSATTQTGTIPSGTTKNKIWQLDFTASKGDVALKSLTFSKDGLLRDTDINSISLTDEQGFLLTMPQRMVNAAVTFTFPSPFTIADGQTRHLTLTVNVSSSFSQTLTTFGLAVVHASDVSSTGAVAGTFPLISPTYSVIKGIGAVGRLTVDSVLISQSSRDVVVGTAAQVLNKFQFSVTNTSEDVLLDELTFTIIGSASADNFAKFTLADDQGHTLSPKVTSSGTTITMDFGKSSYTIPKGTQRTLTLSADIVGGANDTAQFVILHDYDVVAHGATTGFSTAAAAGPSEGDFPVGDGSGASFNAIHLLPGQVLINLNSSTPTTALSSGATNVVLADIDVRALGQAENLDHLDVHITTSGAHTPLVGAVTLQKKGGGALGQIDAGSVMDTTGTLILSSSFAVSSGSTVTLELVGSINASATSLDSYTVSLSNFSFSTPTTGTRLTFGSTVTSPARAIQILALRVRTDPNFKSATLVAGRTGQKVGRFLFQAGAGENILIEQVTLVATSSTPVLFSNGFSNLSLGGKNIQAPTSNLYVFPLNSTVNAGSEAGFDLNVDTTAAVGNATVQFTVQDVVAVGSTSRAAVTPAFESATSPVMTYQSTALTIALDPSFTGGADTLATNQPIAGFTLTASGAENVNISSITVAEAPGASDLSVTRGYKNLRFINAATKGTITNTVSSPVGGSAGNILNGFTVNAGQTLNVRLLIDAQSVTTGDTIQMVIVNIQAKGASSGIPITISNLPITGQTVTF